MFTTTKDLYLEAHGLLNQSTLAQKAEILNLEIQTIRDVYTFHMAGLTLNIEEINFGKAFYIALGKEPVALLKQFATYLSNLEGNVAKDWHNAVSNINLYA